VTIGDNATIAENVRIAENTKIGENITMTSGGEMDGNASSSITSLQNATAVPVNTQINIAKAVAIRAPQLPSIGNNNKQKLPNNNNTYDERKEPKYNNSQLGIYSNDKE
jgi:acyl-[acyl carrier protein]--UDP-N-acetylglucosamine O-acyltransferase